MGETLEGTVRGILKGLMRVRERIGKTRLRYEKDPVGHAEQLTHSDRGSYHSRIGDDRVVFDIADDQIVVLRVGHREEIYKRR